MDVPERVTWFLSSSVTRTPMWPSSASMVLMSRRCGTFPSCRGSAVSRLAVRIGNAAFFAPEMRTSPASGLPPWISSASMSAAGPVFGGVGFHRQRVDLRVHAAAERIVDQPVLLDHVLAGKGRTDDHRLEMLAVAVQLDVVAREFLGDPAFDVFGGNHARLASLVSIPRRPFEGRFSV